MSRTIQGFHRSVLKFKYLKLKGVSASTTVDIAEYSVTKVITMYSPMVGEFCDTMIEA